MRRLLPLAFALFLMGCPPRQGQTSRVSTQADTGVGRAHAGKLQTNTNGLTVEQQNITDRLQMDNTPGSIKHLYVVSAFSGDVLIYSTVKGKVTSSGKRLTPRSVAAGGLATGGDWKSASFYGAAVDIGGQSYRTAEIIQDDGTFGHSIEYLYWWDAQGRYHQHYVSGGQILHVSDQPLRVNSVILNMELTDSDTPESGN